MNDHKDPTQPLGGRTDAASVVRLTQPEYRVFTEGRPLVERTLGRAVVCMPFEECAPSEADSQKRLTSFFRVLDETAADLHVTTVGATARPVTSRIHRDASPDTGERELDGLREMFLRPAVVLFGSPVRLGEEPEDAADALRSPLLGRALQYALAWEGLTNWSLSESAFLAVDLLLESRTNLECAVHLAALCYYRQASTITRSFLESVLAQAYFGARAKDYLSWRTTAGYHLPKVRAPEDKWSVARALKDEKLATDENLAELSRLLDSLQASVHLQHERLMHGKVEKPDEYVGLGFDRERLDLWARDFADSVGLAIRLYHRHLCQIADRWAQRRAKAPTLLKCAVCHADEALMWQKAEVTGLRVLCCRACGHVHEVEHAGVV